VRRPCPQTIDEQDARAHWGFTADQVRHIHMWPLDALHLRLLQSRIIYELSPPSSLELFSNFSGVHLGDLSDPETVRSHICVCSIKDRYYKYCEYRNVVTQGQLTILLNHGSFLFTRLINYSIYFLS
jgi:hypothetical protein